MSDIDPEAMWILRELAHAFAAAFVRRAQRNEPMPLDRRTVQRNARQRRQAEADRERFITERRIA